MSSDISFSNLSEEELFAQAEQVNKEIYPDKIKEIKKEIIHRIKSNSPTKLPELYHQYLKSDLTNEFSESSGNVVTISILLVFLHIVVGVFFFDNQLNPFLIISSSILFLTGFGLKKWNSIILCIIALIISIVLLIQLFLIQDRITSLFIAIAIWYTSVSLFKIIRTKYLMRKI